MKYYDENNCLVNLGNSILKKFGVDTFHNSIPEVDEFIKDKKKVMIILLDGMGSYIVDKLAKENSFFKTHVIHQITSTFPPTTAAATTGLQFCKFPIEDGWMGWTMYVKEYDRIIDIFSSKDSIKKEFFGGNYQALTNNKNWCELINEKHGKEIAHQVFQHSMDKKTPRFPSCQLKYAYKKLKKQDEGFVYCYMTNPDHFLHEEGTDSKHARKFVNKLSRLVGRYAKKNPDVATMVIADHGLIDVKFFYINQYPDIYSLLEKPLCVEPRCASFFVKEGKEATFAALFKKYFGEHFDLYTKEEAVKQKVFGIGEPNQYSLDTLGTFVAVSIDEYCIADRDKSHFKGHHAGGVKEERDIYIIGYKG